MEIIDRIRENFNKGFFGKAMEIPEMPSEYPAWTFKYDNWIGVAVPLDVYIPFSEQFSQVKICTEKNVQIGKQSYDVLMLICYSIEMRREFSLICSQFIYPGIDGQTRKELTGNPAGWWKRWKDMLGNVVYEKAPYDILGEMLVLEKELRNGKSPKWSGVHRATHDIELADASIEVKSTTSRYGYEVTISSIYQMKPTDGKPLELSFIRFEKSRLGLSVEDVAKSLGNLGYDKSELENTLKKLGLEEGRVARHEKYKILEWKNYPVDSNFPAVTESSFKNNRLPENISRFTYTVDLSGVTGYSQI